MSVWLFILRILIVIYMQCAGVLNLGGEVGCIISEGPWLFFGIPNFVKVRWEATGLHSFLIAFVHDHYFHIKLTYVVI